jgi:hypothetical protein
VHVKTSLTGATVGVDVTATEKIWKTFQSLGDIAFAYSYSNVLIEIQVYTSRIQIHICVYNPVTYLVVSTTYLIRYFTCEQLI